MPRAKKPEAKAPATPGPNLDVNAHPQPVQAPTGLPYGENKALTDGQSAAPMAGASAATDAVNTPVTPVNPAQPDSGQMMDMASMFNAPAPILAGATNRPNEPITTGLPIGAGAGPEAMPPAPGSMASIYQILATNTNDPLFAQLAQRARLAGK